MECAKHLAVIRTTLLFDFNCQVNKKKQGKALWLMSRIFFKEIIPCRQKVLPPTFGRVSKNNPKFPFASIHGPNHNLCIRSNMHENQYGSLLFFAFQIPMGVYEHSFNALFS